MKGATFATGSKVPTEVRLQSSHRNWQIGVLSPLMFTSQREGS